MEWVFLSEIFMTKKNSNHLRISCDLDDTINYWMFPYLQRFGTPKNDFEITKNVRAKLMKDKEFWMTLPIKNRPNFIPVQYTTARIIPKQWIKQFIKENGLPNVPVYQVRGVSLSKAKMLKGRVDLHIDDSIKVFKDLNSKGIPCLLIDSPYNREWGPIGRVYSLDIDEIIEAYNLFMDTVFYKFKQLL